ncbi:MAG: HlyD family efflux transporter periplasmic adaptor subunit [Deltaproteobacteria bacterium]|nr:HlyD family efflux transporter periplasmic adaptor subunit [Nannocystaceae bacterium]
MRRWLATLSLCACTPLAQAGSAEEEGIRVTRGELVLTVDVSGKLRAVDSDRLGPPPIPDMWNFQIAMMAEEGSEVTTGAPVLAFDASELERKLEEKIAERDAAATQLELKQAAARVTRQDEQLAIAEARSKHRKAAVKADAPAEITAVIELEKAKRDLELAQLEIDHLILKSKAAARRDAAEIAAWRSKHDRAVERVTMIETAQQQMTVTSPRTGTVIHQADWDGKKKKAGDTAWRAETVLQVVSLAQMEGDGEIDEVDIRRVVPDQAVSLRVDAQADVELHGRVRRIAKAVQRASPENPLKVAHVDISLDADAGLRLRPGMRFRGTIELERLSDVLLIPLERVGSSADGPIVHRVTTGGIEVVPVVLGARSGERVVVVEGLGEGDELVLPAEGE